MLSIGWLSESPHESPLSPYTGPNGESRIHVGVAAMRMAKSQPKTVAPIHTQPGTLLRSTRVLKL